MAFKILGISIGKKGPSAETWDKFHKLFDLDGNDSLEFEEASMFWADMCPNCCSSLITLSNVDAQFAKIEKACYECSGYS